jgi:hypothetical protein
VSAVLGWAGIAALAVIIDWAGARWLRPIGERWAAAIERKLRGEDR